MSSHRAVVFDQCHFRYFMRRPTISGFSLRIGSFPAALIGANGSGKSTLLALAAGALRPQHGEIRLISGTRRGSATSRTTHRNSAWLPQEIRAVRGLNAREQVAYAGWLKGLNRAESWDCAQTALERVGLSGQSRVLSSSLSGGQRRRMGIAQAFIAQPQFLLLDEPYAGLDMEHKQLIRHLFAELSESAALLIATHDIQDLVTDFAEVVALREGHVTHQDSPAKPRGHFAP